MTSNLDARRAAVQQAEGVMIDGPRTPAPDGRIHAADLLQMMTDTLLATKNPRLNSLVRAVREAPSLDLMIALTPLAAAINVRQLGAHKARRELADLDRAIAGTDAENDA
jgi:hypothetical protein